MVGTVLKGESVLHGFPRLPFWRPCSGVLAQEETLWLLSRLILGFQVTLRTAGRSEERLFLNMSLRRDQCVLMTRMSFPL